MVNRVDVIDVVENLMTRVDELEAQQGQSPRNNGACCAPDCACIDALFAAVERLIVLDKKRLGADATRMIAELDDARSTRQQ